MKFTRAFAAAGLVLFGATACQSDDDPATAQPEEGAADRAGDDSNDNDEVLPVGQGTIDPAVQNSSFEVPGTGKDGEDGSVVKLGEGERCAETSKGTYCVAAAAAPTDDQSGGTILWHRIVKSGVVEAKTVKSYAPIDSEGVYVGKNAQWVDAGPTQDCSTYTLTGTGEDTANEVATGCSEGDVTVAWKQVSDAEGVDTWTPQEK